MTSAPPADRRSVPLNRDPGAIKPLLQALRDKHAEWFVRREIVEALGEGGDASKEGMAEP